MAIRKKQGKKGRQLSMELGEKRPWGGKRRRSGRKPKGDVAMVPHGRRPRFTRCTPVHVNWKIAPGITNLRNTPARDVLWRSLGKACDRFNTRITYYCFQENHIHLIVESERNEALSRAMQGLGVRIARNVNKYIGRKGKLFADHYFGRLQKHPT